MPEQPVEGTTPSTPQGKRNDDLRQGEERFRLLVESVSDYAIFMLDPQGYVLTWNPGAERFKGYKAEEIIGQSYTRFYTPEDLAAGRPQRLLNTARTVGHVEDEGWRVRKDGTRFWADVVITAIKNGAGEIIGFAKVTRDLTERKQAEDQRRQFKLLVESVTDYAIIMLTPEGRVASWNKGAENLKGYQESEILGERYEKFFTPEAIAAGRPRQLLQEARSTGHVEDEGWRMRKDGTQFWASAVLTAIYDEKGEFVGYGKVTRDLTQRKQMEELSARTSQLQAANKLKSQFLANMSHELRTPLNSIIGYTELVLTDEAQKLDELGESNLDTVLRNARHLLTLINEVLDLSKIEAGQAVMHPTRFNPATIVQAVLHAAKPLAEQKGLMLRFSADPALDQVVSDETKLHQILINLVNNAIKFTEHGHVEVHMAARDADHWAVTVTDTGIGIAPEHHELVFQEFRQVDPSSTRTKGGTGLGLAISKKLAGILGGDLTLRSALGQGSTFELVLPREPVTKPADAPAAEGEPV